MNPREFVAKRYPKLGVNKQRETARLLYEISKRDHTSYDDILAGFDFQQYAELKSFLLRRRYPTSVREVERDAFFLPSLEIDPQNEAPLDRPLLAPKTIIAEESVASSELTQRLKNHYPNAQVIVVSRLKDYLKGTPYSIADYNRRTERIFVVRQVADFYEACPCTKGALHCGYNVMNVGFGCPFECQYCFLQEYQNVPGLVLPANLDDTFRQFESAQLRKGSFGMTRLGTGEFTDSLALDPITEYSKSIIEFFRRHPEVVFEFKTKSANVGNLVSITPPKNIVVSWSLNPQKVVSSVEPLAATLTERLDAASKCVQAGYQVGFHFDPLIYYSGWENDYKETVQKMFAAAPSDRIAWISLGTLRFTPALKKVIETRFPHNTILDEELILDFDGKMRYPKRIRDEMIRKMERWIRAHSKDVIVYPCMEEPAVWNYVGLQSRG